MWTVVVNRHRVAANRKAAPGDRTPVFRIARGKHGKPHYADRVSFPQGAELVYDLDHPLPCGATVWLEAPSLVEEGGEAAARDRGAGPARPDLMDALM